MIDELAEIFGMSDKERLESTLDKAVAKRGSIKQDIEDCHQLLRELKVELIKSTMIVDDVWSQLIAMDNEDECLDRR